MSMDPVQSDLHHLNIKTNKENLYNIHTPPYNSDGQSEYY